MKRLCVTCDARVHVGLNTGLVAALRRRNQANAPLLQQTIQGNQVFQFRHTPAALPAATKRCQLETSRESCKRPFEHGSINPYLRAGVFTYNQRLCKKVLSGSCLISGAKENMKNMPADFQDEDEVEDFKPLTAEEASDWRSRFPQVSVWRIVIVQAQVGIVVAALAWWMTGRPAAGWSAAYGALAVVLPAALFARGVVRQRPGGAGAAMAGIFGWELVKLVLCIAMLAAAPKLVPDLSWLALLVGLIVVMKTYWIALLVRSNVPKTD